MLFWNANPILVQLGPIAVHWYGALFAAGFLLGYQLMQRIYRQEGRPTEQLDKLLTYIFIGTVVGARLAHTLIYEPEYYLAHPIDILKIWEGGGQPWRRYRRAARDLVVRAPTSGKPFLVVSRSFSHPDRAYRLLYPSGQFRTRKLSATRPMAAGV